MPTSNERLGLRFFCFFSFVLVLFCSGLGSFAARVPRKPPRSRLVKTKVDTMLYPDTSTPLAHIRALRIVLTHKHIKKQRKSSVPGLAFCVPLACCPQPPKKDVTRVSVPAAWEERSDGLAATKRELEKHAKPEKYTIRGRCVFLLQTAQV